MTIIVLGIFPVALPVRVESLETRSSESHSRGRWANVLLSLLLDARRLLPSQLTR
jgi:hypothetical protein